MQCCRYSCCCRCRAAAAAAQQYYRPTWGAEGTARAAAGWEEAGWVMAVAGMVGWGSGAVGWAAAAGWAAEARVVGVGTGVRAAQDWGVMGAVVTAEREAVGSAVKEAMG